MNFKSIFILSVISLFIFTASAQCINGVKSMPIYKMGEDLVEEFDRQGMEIVKIEYDLVLDYKLTYRYLSPDWKYKIMAFADGGVKDLDIYLYAQNSISGEWEIVAQSAGDGATPSLFHIPEEYTEFGIEVVAEEFYEGYSAARYGLFFVHE